MARKKQVMFSRSDLEFVAQSVLANALTKVGQQILNSGAQPSPEIGVIIMHLSNGSNLIGKEVHDKTVQLELQAVENSDAAEALAVMKEIISGESK